VGPELVAVKVATEPLLLTDHPVSAPLTVPYAEVPVANATATSSADVPELPAVNVLPPKITVSPELNAEKVAVATSVVAAYVSKGEVAPKVIALSVPDSVDCIVNTYV
jgi:hypothetical protein